MKSKKLFNFKKMKVKFISVSSWEISPIDRCLMVYSKINEKCVVTRYFIDEYMVEDEGFKIHAKYLIKQLELSEMYSDDMWEICDYKISCKTIDHIYKDKRFNISPYQTIGKYVWRNVIGTHRNVISRLQSSGAPLIK